MPTPEPSLKNTPSLMIRVLILSSTDGQKEAIVGLYIFILQWVWPSTKPLNTPPIAGDAKCSKGFELTMWAYQERNGQRLPETSRGLAKGQLGGPRDAVFGAVGAHGAGVVSGS